MIRRTGGFAPIDRITMSGRAFTSASPGISATPTPAATRPGTEPEPAAPQTRDRVELRLGLGEPDEDGVGVADERLAGVREAHATRVALDQGGSSLALERRDLL